MYIRGLVLLLFCLSFLSPLCNVLYFIQYNYILSLSLISSLLPPLSSLAEPPVIVQPCRASPAKSTPLPCRAKLPFQPYPRSNHEHSHCPVHLTLRCVAAAPQPTLLPKSHPRPTVGSLDSDPAPCPPLTVARYLWFVWTITCHVVESATV
jgi:hypothetical protein